MSKSISIIVPTRGNPEQMTRFLASVLSNASTPSRVEVIMVVDDDDPASQAITFDGLDVVKVVVERGLTMGALNAAGYEASRGNYIMLCNDDVIVKTHSWDERIIEIFRSFDDDIALVHTNDMIFGDKLCTFPFLTRRFCEFAGGICPAEYKRYRIDDHIFNVFNLLSLLGQNRIIYCPDIIFEHRNVVTHGSGKIEYIPIPDIHSKDTELFNQLLDDRKTLAVKLAGWIDANRRKEISKNRVALLSPVHDSVSLRRPEFVRTMPGGRPAIGSRVTIGVVSANANGDHARLCIDLLKLHTRNFDLILLDNNYGPNFNHAREMNRILEICRTDYLVLMDDDVWVTPGWLESLLGCVSPEVGVVTPMHRARDGSISYAGIAMRPDLSGHHSHIYDVPQSTLPSQTLCSAIMLIDMAKVGHLRVDESYSKYFLDIDYGLRVWEAGFKVVIDARCACTHIGGATLVQGSAKSNELFEMQRQTWCRKWIDSGRYIELRDGVWKGVHEFRDLITLPSIVAELMERKVGETVDQCAERLIRRLGVLRSAPCLQQYVRTVVDGACKGQYSSVYDPELGHLMLIAAVAGVPAQINGDFHGHDIHLIGLKFYAVPAGTPAPADKLQAGTVPGQITSSSLGDLRDRLIRGLIAASAPSQKEHFAPDAAAEASASVKVAQPRLIKEGVHGYNIIHADRYYGILQSDGHFSMERVISRGYADIVIADNITDVERQIARRWLIRLPYKMLPFGKRIADYGISRAQWIGMNIGKRPQDRNGATVGAGSSAQFARRNLSKIAPALRGEQARNARVVDQNRMGYAIFLYEHKYFCIPLDMVSMLGEDPFRNADRIAATDGVIVVNTLGEIDGVIGAGNTEVDAGGNCLVAVSLPLDRVQRALRSIGIDPARCEYLIAGNAEGGLKMHDVGRSSLLEWARADGSLPKELRGRPPSRIVLPWSFPESWTCNTLEAALAKLADSVEIITAPGISRRYLGENLHRLVYNKAYLSSMFQCLPSPQGKSVLEVGCSDGMVCDLIAACGASDVTGIDVMLTTGLGFPGKAITYKTMDATRMLFADESFDIVYSIATLEHVSDAAAVLAEILRVTKRGGYAYIQAGPLYHSPFGHHMFSYFQDYPWIHLLRSTEEIIALARECGIDKLIERDLGRSADDYIKGMLTFEHVNGLFLHEYGLEAFKARKDIEVLKFNISYEGRDLITDEILRGVAPLDRELLTQHGFEIAFKRL